MEAIEPEIEKTTPKKGKKVGLKSLANGIQGVVDGRIIVSDRVTRMVPYLLLVSVLLLFYIGNRYNAEQMVRRIAAAKKELKELRSASIATESQLGYKNLRTEVIKEVSKQNMGLVESEVPPIKIEMEE